MQPRFNPLEYSVSKSNYRSAGERQIAQFLDYAGLRFEYEPAVLIKEREYSRIWYPDFKLSDYQILIEYFGIERSHQYDEKRNYRLRTYEKNNLDVIALYPDDLTSSYQDKIFQGIENKVYRSLARYENQRYRNSQKSSGYQRKLKRY
jgi:hypothetical protein